MLLTIWNFTHEPISGFVNPERKLSDRFSLRKARTPSVPLPPPAFDLHPHIDFSTTIPKGRCKEITLLCNPRNTPGAQVDTTVMASVTAQADENPVVRQAVNISVSMGITPSWKVVAADADTPWTLILTRVRFQVNDNRGSVLLNLEYRLQNRIVNSWFSRREIWLLSFLNCLTAFHCLLYRSQVSEYARFIFSLHISRHFIRNP